MNSQIKKITRLAAVAALYVVFTVVVYPLSYGEIQFRFSEILVLLCFYRKDYSIALIIGCFIANIFSPIQLDMVFGTLATALAVLAVSNSKNLIIASLYPVIFNGIIVGLELHFLVDLPLVATILSVAIGEFVVVSIIALIIFKIISKNKGFMELIEANQNISFS